MQITLYYGFAKKNNSTKLPGSGASSVTVTGYLKEPCSVMNPVIAIQNYNFVNGTVSPVQCVYAYIQEFNRYYFISDWIWNDGVWNVRMNVDVLGSWRTEIGTMSEYVLRTDSTSNFNPHVSDSAYPATTDFDIHEVTINNAFTNDLDVGCYVVGIISGDDVDSVGAISYYIMDSQQFGDLKQMLFSDANLQAMGILNQSGQQLVYDMSTEVLKTLYNPYQYIVSCMWFPFPDSSILDKTAVTSIDIGWWNYNLSGYRIYAQTTEFGENGPLPAHPQAATRGSYLNYAPYSRHTLIGRFGTVAIDTSYYKLGNAISIGYLIDLITGQCRTSIEVYESEGTGTPHHTVIAQRDFLIGVPIQLAQVGRDYLGAVSSGISTAAGAIGQAITGNVSGAISTLSNGVYNTVSTLMPQMETSGSNGNFISPSSQTRILSQFFRIVDENIHHMGRPLYAVCTINTLSGFVLCADGDIDLACMDEERDRIRAYMIGGFFWE